MTYRTINRERNLQNDKNHSIRCIMNYTFSSEWNNNFETYKLQLYLLNHKNSTSNLKYIFYKTKEKIIINVYLMKEKFIYSMSNFINGSYNNYITENKNKYI